MQRISPKILIDGREVDYFDGSYQLNGSLTAATLDFSLPLQLAGDKRLWNKEVTFYFNEFDTVPLFRGWIKRTNPSFDNIRIHAEDALGYMVKGGENSLATITLTDTDNLDGLTAGAGIVKAISKARLGDKLKTDFIGNTSPVVGSSTKPIRGQKKVLDIVKEYLGKSINTGSTLPRPNIGRIIDDGSNSQFVIELESDITRDTAEINYVFNEFSNIISLSIINRKIPTVVTVTGKGNVQGTFSHTTARAAYDTNYFDVKNNNLTSPAECKDFAAKVFEANLLLQYEYGLQTFEGVYLSENDIIKIETDDPEFSGNYRIIGKTISFSPSSYSITLSINKRPPVLSEYIANLDN